MINYISVVLTLLVAVYFHRQYVKKPEDLAKIVFKMVVVIIVIGVLMNNLSNRYLNEPRKAEVRSPDVREKYYDRLESKQLSPVMDTQQRQERTDVLIDRKQITDKIYDKGE